jgi:hypothetical protein
MADFEHVDRQLTGVFQRDRLEDPHQVVTHLSMATVEDGFFLTFAVSDVLAGEELGEDTIPVHPVAKLYLSASTMTKVLQLFLTNPVAGHLAGIALQNIQQNSQGEGQEG